MSKEVMQQALEALVLNNAEWKSLADSGDSGYWKAEDQDHYQQTNKAITVLETELAKPDFWEGYVPEPVKPAQQEPESFEQWNAKQHGDPEEIGFLQALRIAYGAGQDSITSPPAQKECEKCSHKND
jgi:hypothetical protein